MADEPVNNLAPVKKERKVKIKEKHVAVLDQMTQGKTITQAMIAVGYKPYVARSPKHITETKSWKQLMNLFLPEVLIAERHNALLHQKQLNYFVFPKTMADQEIKEHVEANGLELVVVRPSDKGKMAFFAQDNVQALSKGIEMAYKLHGKFNDDKPPIVPQAVYNLFYKPEIQAQLKTFEDTLKQTIINESIREVEIVDREQADAGGATAEPGTVA